MRYHINGYCSAKNHAAIMQLLEQGAKSEKVGGKERPKKPTAKTPLGELCLGLLKLHGGLATQEQLKAHLVANGKSGSSYSATMSKLIKEGVCDRIGTGHFRLISTLRQIA